MTNSTTKMNIMEIDGYTAIVQYDPDIEMFRGEFRGLNGGADFYADSVGKLLKEGAISLKVFLDMCEESGIEPRREYSGKFNLRVEPSLHASAATEAAAEGKSLNQYVSELLEAKLAVVGTPGTGSMVSAVLKRGNIGRSASKAAGLPFTFTRPPRKKVVKKKKKKTRHK